jgi:chromosome partitioning protein
MPHTIAVLSQKGGTGKTDYFDVAPDAQPTIAEVLSAQSTLAEAIHADVVPANLSLAEAELMLGGKMGRELTLRRALAADDGIEGYDVVMIDCPPSLGLLTVNALVAANYALITAEAQYFALQGVEQAMEVIDLARDSLNPDLALLGIVLNLADMRTVHSREALASLNESFPGKVFESVIRSSIAYAESAERAVSILDHRPDLGADYLALATEMQGRLPGPG